MDVRMRRFVHLSELLPVTILFEGHFHALASLMLRGFDFLAKGTGGTIRPTAHGVGSAYSRLFLQVDAKEIGAILGRTGLDPNSTVEWDGYAPPEQRRGPGTKRVRSAK